MPDQTNAFTQMAMPEQQMILSCPFVSPKRLGGFGAGLRFLRLIFERKEN
jgi:hypothetical protein